MAWRRASPRHDAAPPKASAVPSPTGVLVDGRPCEEGSVTGVGVLAGPAWQQLSRYGLSVLPYHLCGPEQPTRSHGKVPSSIVSFSSQCPPSLPTLDSQEGSLLGSILDIGRYRHVFEVDNQELRPDSSPVDLPRGGRLSYCHHLMSPLEPLV